MDTVSTICSHSRTSMSPCQRLTKARRLTLCKKKRGGDKRACIILPISLNRAPGLHILIDSSRQMRAVRISFSDSSSTRPTGYVSFKSPWKPERCGQGWGERIAFNTNRHNSKIHLRVADTVSNTKRRTLYQTRTNVDNVSLLQLALIGDSMANNFIDRTEPTDVQC